MVDIIVGLILDGNHPLLQKMMDVVDRLLISKRQTTNAGDINQGQCGFGRPQILAKVDNDRRSSMFLQRSLQGTGSLTSFQVQMHQQFEDIRQVSVGLLLVQLRKIYLRTIGRLRIEVYHGISYS